MPMMQEHLRWSVLAPGLTSLLLIPANTRKAFILDTRTHTTSNLLNAGLDEYQGPALVAYNNAKFSPRDFESLASLGASRKEQDALATGKFGRGFSSVGFTLIAKQLYANECRFSIGLIARLSCLTLLCSSWTLTTPGLRHGTLLGDQNGTSRPMHKMTP